MMKIRLMPYNIFNYSKMWIGALHFFIEPMNKKLDNTGNK